MAHTTRSMAQYVAVRQLPPLDYSFKELKDIQAVVDEEPRRGKRKKRASADAGESRELATTKLQSSASGARPSGVVQRGITTSIKLDNNELSSLEGLTAVVKEIMPSPERLTWLDLSCNSLTTIDQDLVGCANLTSLYLHANNITSLKEVKKLGKLTQLKALTLHGNPVEEVKNYRFFVISILPSLRSLDFGPVTPLDRDKAMAWRSMTKPRRRADQM